MPRPKKSRMVCHFPGNVEFCSVSGEKTAEPIVMTVDEYETVRLIDGEGMSQEQCGAQMQIARTTVQKIYESARVKLAAFLVQGRPLRIEGGDFRLCGGTGTRHGCGQCVKRRFRQQYETPKGDRALRVAVTYENGAVFQHFGHTSQFKVYEVSDGAVVRAEIVDTEGSGHGALAGILTALNVDVLICGGIGGGARMALDAAGIRLYGGVSGSADAAVEALAAGTLAFDPDAECSHHGHGHAHGQSHTCGSHGCGEHHCGHH